MNGRLGFGVHKLDPKPGATRDERLSRSRHMLARVLNLKTTVAFVGSGCSAPRGFPTWKEFTTEAVEHTLKEIQSSPLLQLVGEQLQRFQKQLTGKANIKADQLLFMLGVCQQIFEQKDGAQGKTRFREFVARRFGEASKPPELHNPYDALMKLPISRFVTSNYDFEIEKALAANRGVRKNRLGLDGPVCPPDELLTFTQQPEHFNHLALFVLSRVKDANNMVFHCHGSYKDPDSMVITEADYQSWYFGERDEAGIAFRQTLNLLFGSNPILFVGFGLGDDDLMRPLRLFASEDLKGKLSRPLFALLPQKESLTKEERELNEDYFDQLFDRYGVHVISYDLCDRYDPSSKKTLFHALTNLDDFRRECRDYWLEKPRIRQVEITANHPDPYQHYPLVRDKTDDFKGPRIEELLDDLHKAVKDRARVIGLIGLGGTGKSWFAHQLMQSVYQEQVANGRDDFKGFFFWSSYYSNDALTGLDRALAYLDPHKQHEGDRIERFRKCLRSNDRYLLVFDGIERFLQETDNPIEGKGFTALADNLLRVMRDSKSKSTVVITSRLWPKSFGPFQATKGPIRSYLIQRYRLDDIKKFEPFNWLSREQEDLSALVSLLDGHAHALVLVAEMLRNAQQDGAPNKLKAIKRSLSATPPDARGERMIRMAIESLNERSNGLASKLLDRLSVFMVPVAESTVDICFKEAVERKPNSCIDQCTLIKELTLSRLIHEAVSKRGKHEYTAYTVHPIVREYIFHQIHGAPVGSLPNFSLPGFTAATSAFHPGNEETVKMMEKLFDHLCAEAEKKHAEGEGFEARGLCRSAFSLIRSRMEALTVPRWGSYDRYLKFLIPLSHLAKKISEGPPWSYAERQSIDKVEGLYGPLYADELAWLYNEMGLACYGEGAMPDTLAIWEQGLEINRVIDSREEGGNYLFQSQCNLGAAYIHYGHLDTAEKYLREAERTNFRLNDKDHAGRIIGYLALIKHLRGNLPQAEEMYDLALRTLDEQGNNPRAKSIFLRHKADLKVKLGDFDEARKCVDISRGLAEEGNFPELAASARLALGHWFRSRKKYSEAHREYNAALSEAKRIRMRRLECEVLSEFARLALDLGDSHISRQRAVESLRIANELVLGLKQTHDLVVLGIATIEGRQRKLGIAYLKHAKRLADQQGYWLRSHEAEEQLHRFGEATADSLQQ